jgi:hypothetical protein
MSWGMIDGWREDFNEGPYDYLAVRDGWEIFSHSSEKYEVTSPDGAKRSFATVKEAKEYAYENGCTKEA